MDSLVTAHDRHMQLTWLPVTDMVQTAAAVGQSRPAMLLHGISPRLCVLLLLQGCFPGADASKVSSRAKARGAAQCGTLGSGNHYVEVQVGQSSLRSPVIQIAAATAGGLGAIIATAK